MPRLLCNEYQIFGRKFERSGIDFDYAALCLVENFQFHDPSFVQVRVRVRRLPSCSQITKEGRFGLMCGFIKGDPLFSTDKTESFNAKDDALYNTEHMHVRMSKPNSSISNPMQ